MILYLKDKGNGVGIKTEITGDDFKLVTMMFVGDEYFTTLGKITVIQWWKVLYQKKITMDKCSGGLGVSGGHMHT